MWVYCSKTFSPSLVDKRSFRSIYCLTSFFFFCVCMWTIVFSISCWMHHIYSFTWPMFLFSCFISSIRRLPAKSNLKYVYTSTKSVFLQSIGNEGDCKYKAATHQIESLMLQNNILENTKISQNYLRTIFST